MTEGGPDTPSPPSSPYSSPTTFLSTFSDEVLTRCPTMNPARTGCRQKAGIPLTPPEEPALEQQVQGTQIEGGATGY